MRSSSIRSKTIWLIKIFLLLLLVAPKAVTAKPAYLKVYLSTWDKSRIMGRLHIITDSTITIITNKGTTHTFKASKTKNLKIWRTGIIAPIAVGGAIAGAVISNLLDQNNSFLPAYVVGLPLGFVGGLIVGELSASIINVRRIHVNDFIAVRKALSDFPAEMQR